VTPDSRTVYVANSGSGTVTPIDTATARAAPPIPVGSDPVALAVTPDGRTVVLDWAGGTVTPIDTATDTAGPPIGVGSFPSAIAVSPRGGIAYVASYGSDTVTPISAATQTADAAIPAGYVPDALVITPNGREVYVVDGNSDEITPANSISGTVTPLATASGRAGPPISVGLYSYPTALAVTGSTAVVLDTHAGQVSLINTRTRQVFAPVTVGNFPEAVAIST
jgi:hyaluronoglucosaminidase